MPIEITVPGSKSIANRALVLAALTGNHNKIQNLPDCDDTKYMQNALIELKKPNPKLYTGNAGTTTRFLTAYATLLEKEVTIDGDERMRERPLSILTDALNQLGAHIETTSGCPPLSIHSSKLKGGEISLPGNISSQYLSALLMVAPFSDSKTVISIEQELCSRPYIKITLKLLEEFGIEIKNNNFERFEVNPQKGNPPQDYTIEADASSASYIGAYCALHPRKTVILKNLNRKSIQGDIKFLDYLEDIGCKIEESGSSTLISGPDQIKSLGEIDMNETPDLVMTFAVLGAFSPGKTKITNISNLRIKETDRIQALENELKKIGAKVKTGPDYIEIEGNNSLNNSLIKNAGKPININTYNDHRMAMSFAILKDTLPNLTIEKPDCVSKSYTTFWDDLAKLTNN